MNMKMNLILKLINLAINYNKMKHIYIAFIILIIGISLVNVYFNNKEPIYQIKYVDNRPISQYKNKFGGLVDSWTNLIEYDIKDYMFPCTKLQNNYILSLCNECDYYGSGNYSRFSQYAWRVYFEEKVLDLQINNCYVVNNFIVRDNKKLYVWWKLVEWIDLKNLNYNNFSPFVWDTKNVYFFEKQIADLNWEEVKLLDKGWIQIGDKNINTNDMFDLYYNSK